MKYLVVVVFLLLGVPGLARAASVQDIVFPVVGDVSFSDTFNDARSGGRVHHATDIMAAKMSPILATVDGTILFAPMEEPSYGYMIMLGGDDGYQYNYVHINNDTPGTDDGLGGPEHAYMPGIQKGVHVKRGQQIAWVGDSGNAEDVGAHLHFEMLDENEAIVDPYASLVAAYDVREATEYTFTPASVTEGAISINDDLDIPEAEGDTACISGSLIRTAASPAVYYCGRDGGRYVFPNEATFSSWYSDFSSVITVTDDVMASVPIRGTVTFKPGRYLLKLPSVSKVYAVGAGGALHWIPSAEIAEALYGANWAKQVRDLPESFYPAYTLSDDVTVAE